jgi:hypothetical protein
MDGGMAALHCTICVINVKAVSTNVSVSNATLNGRVGVTHP